MGNLGGLGAVLPFNHRNLVRIGQNPDGLRRRAGNRHGDGLVVVDAAAQIQGIAGRFQQGHALFSGT